ncbi:hypothetical protein ACFCX6_31800 [Streptomyces sp. NPDC056353]|uniref:hypothetical protein n=2 Tax=Streptomyces TaxID=1883 RepID=UPI0035E24B15
MLVARVRAVAGRVATVAGSAVLTGGLFAEPVTLPGVFAAAAAAGVGLATNGKILRAPDAAKGTAIAVYAAPHAGVAAILVGERLAPDGTVSVLVQAGIVALWTGATWWLRPGQLARELVDESVDQEIAEANGEDTDAAAEVAVPEQPAYASPAARWWAEEIAVEDGIAPGTVLLEHEQVDENCVAVIFGSGKRGTPVTVPSDAKARLSAYLDVPEELIEIGPVPGRGAGVRLLVVGQRPKPAEEEKKTSGSDEEVWAEIAATAMPGVELVEAATYEIRKELT